MKKTLLILSGVLLIVLVLFGVMAKRPPSPPSKTEKLQVVTSFYPLFFFASEIGGDKVKVTNITPSGSEPHEYEPTAQDMAVMEKSDLIVLNGANFEPWADKVKNTMETFDQSMQDPHVWLNPRLAKVQVKKIADGLMRVSPQNEAYFKERTVILISKLDKLDDEYRSRLSTCEKNTIVTAHSAFHHLSKEYGLEQIALTGLTPEEEPTASELAEVVKASKAKDVKFIFFETMVSPKLADTVAMELGVKTMVLDPIEGLSQEDLQKGSNYFSIMYANLRNLRTALSCK